MAFQIRAGQKYHDANHPTAAAYVIEMTMDLVRAVTTDPVEFYSILFSFAAITQLGHVISDARFGDKRGQGPLPGEDCNSDQGDPEKAFAVIQVQIRREIAESDGGRMKRIVNYER